MTETAPLYLRFPDAETALAVARAISGNPDVTELPPDGWLDGVYFNIAAIGTLYEPAAEGETPVALPGYHVNGLWRGPADTIPAALAQFMTFPESPQVVFG